MVHKNCRFKLNANIKKCVTYLSKYYLYWVETSLSNPRAEPCCAKSKNEWINKYTAVEPVGTVSRGIFLLLLPWLYNNNKKQANKPKTDLQTNQKTPVGVCHVWPTQAYTRGTFHPAEQAFFLEKRKCLFPGVYADPNRWQLKYMSL